MNMVCNGITVLRAARSSKRDCFIICNATRSGGWIPFGSSWYSSLEIANKKIDELIEKRPDKFKKD